MTRHTTMVVGPTGGGKSVIIKTLCEAQTKYAHESIYVTLKFTSLLNFDKIPVTELCQFLLAIIILLQFSLWILIFNF